MPSVLDGLLDKKTSALLRTLLLNSDQLFHLHSLSRSARVPVTTTSRIVRRLVKLGIVTETKVGKLVLYKAALTEKASAVRELL